jgi:hypothetical protein
MISIMSLNRSLATREFEKDKRLIDSCDYCVFFADDPSLAAQLRV